MKWLILALVLLHPAAFSKNVDVIFNNITPMSESMLDRQRGGFVLPGINYSIGLKMKVLLDGAPLFDWRLIDLSSGLPADANREIIRRINGGEVAVTPVIDKGKIGFILKNSASGVRTDATIDLDVGTPDLRPYQVQQKISSRIRAATKRVGY